MPLRQAGCRRERSRIRQEHAIVLFNPQEPQTPGPGFCGPLAQHPTELIAVTIRPEDILTTAEAALLQRADRGYLPCPACQRPLQGVHMLSDLYQGIVLVCPDVEGCRFHEY
jgi:hypothetical protein